MLNVRLPDKDMLVVLCLGAHCDDIEIGCGGTLLDLSQRRTLSVTWAVFSSNSTRAVEVRHSAAAFAGGASDWELVVKDHRDGFLPYQGGRVKEDFEQLKQQIHPDLVFTHYRHDLHQDHRLVSELTWNTFRNHLILEYEIPKYDGDLGNPNAFYPLSEEMARAKVRNLLEHYPSQSGKGWFTEDLFLSLMRLRGAECHSPSGLAEAFYARKMVVAP